MRQQRHAARVHLIRSERRHRVFVATAVSSKADATFKPGLYGDGDASDDRSSHKWVLQAIDKRTDHPDCYRGHAMLGTPDPQRALAAELPHFESMDMTDLVCPDQQCRPTVGNVYVYFDDDHLSEMYAHTLAPEFTRRAEQALSAAGVQL